MLPVSLDCRVLIAPSVFCNSYFQRTIKLVFNSVARVVAFRAESMGFSPSLGTCNGVCGGGLNLK